MARRVVHDEAGGAVINVRAARGLPSMETCRQAPRNFFDSSSGLGAAQVVARQKRIRKEAVNLRMGNILKCNLKVSQDSTGVAG